MKRILFGLLICLLLAACQKEADETKSASPAPAASNASGNKEISGKVADTGQNPIKEARIEIYLVNSNGRTGKKIAETKSDADGAFRFAEIPILQEKSQYYSLIASSPGKALGGRNITALSSNINDAAITLTEPCSIEGTVVDSSKKPVAGAKIYPQAADTTAKPGEHVVNTFPGADEYVITSDAQGKFKISQMPTAYALGAVVYHPDYATLYMLPEGPPPTLKPNSTDTTLTLLAPGSISGTVVNEQTGKPEPNVEMIVNSLGLDPRGGFGWTAAIQCDSNGNFKIGNLPPLQFAFAAAPGKGDGVLLQKANVPVTEGQQVTNVKLTWTAGAVLSGVLTDNRTGLPISDARIWVSKSEGENVVWNGSANTDEKGRWSVRVPGGEIIIAATGSGGAPRFSTQHESLRRKDLDITVGKDMPDIKLELYSRPTIKISASVVGPDGKPLDGVHVLAGSAWKLGPTKTNLEGKFSAETPIDKPEEYAGKSFTFLLSDPIRNLFGMINIDPAAIRPGERSEKVVMEPAGSAKIHLKTDDNKIIKGVQAQLQILMKADDPKSAMPCSEVLKDKDTSPDGVISLSGLGAGKNYILLAAMESYGKVITPVFQIKAGETTDVNDAIFKKATAILSGKITDATTGLPLNGAGVMAEGKDQPMQARTNAGATGAYSLAPLVKGDAVIISGMKGYKEFAQKVELKDGTTTTLDMKLEPDTSGASGLVAGATAPTVSGVDWIQGRDQLKEMKGKIAILAFLSASSKTTETLAQLQKIGNETGKGKAIVIAVFDTTSPVSKIKEALEASKFAFPAGSVAEDRKQGWESPTFKAWEISGLPTIHMISGDGKILQLDVPLGNLMNEAKAAVGLDSNKSAKAAKTEMPAESEKPTTKSTKSGKAKKGK